MPAGYTPPMNITRIITAGLKTGLILSAATTAVILAASQAENKAPWAALNCIAHIVDGDEKTQPTDFSRRESSLGFLINATAMCTWAVLYEGALSALNLRSTPLTAAVTSLKAYVIDYKIVPKRYTPGIERRLSPPSVALSYVVFAAALALSPLWNRSR
jgi:hypothetical protein